MRSWVARHLRYLADRIDRAHAPRSMGWSFTFEPRVGIVFHKDGTVDPKHHKGCPLWYLSDDDYQLAFDRATGVR